MAPELVLNIDTFEKFENYNDEEDDARRDSFYDKGIDVWSLGVCLYELIYDTVIFPYDIEDIAQLKVFFKDVNQDYVDMTIRHSSNLDSKLETILCKMLKIDRFTRMTAQDLCSFVSDGLKTKGELTMMDTLTYDPRLYYDVRVKISTSVRPCEVNVVEEDTRGVFGWLGLTLGLW
jgi:serine/threonine protein kinase